MYFHKFRSLRNYQCVALAFCLLVLNQQVVGSIKADTGRRKYESAFQNLFENGKIAVDQLASFHLTVRDDKALRQNTDEVMAFVKANPDKIAIGAGLVVSSWLLYQSIALGSEIQRFFGEIEELKGQFNQYYLVAVPELEELYHRIRKVPGIEPAKQEAYIRKINKKLMTYYDDMQKIIDHVDDIIADVYQGRIDAVISTALSGSIAGLAGVALVIGGPVTVAPVIWKSSVITTVAISSCSTGMSLRNVQDLTKASSQLKTLKKDLRELRDDVMKMIIHMM